eukprot:TRINITY_DN32658_c0_g1_i1.p1 TRINITY_DN32658_c0_g1~~TRINITY_DN32658_c0_g1_i1.p1  ORF type:complete len:382 (+),score=83.52 TRINITY_DN32658_c0_g1_i1:72-1217(+)
MMLDEAAPLYPSGHGGYGGLSGGQISPPWRMEGAVPQASPWRLDGGAVLQVLNVSQAHALAALLPVLYAARAVELAGRVYIEGVLAALALAGCLRLVATCSHLLRVQLAVPLGNVVDATSSLAPLLLLVHAGLPPAAVGAVVYGCVVAHTACFASVLIIAHACERRASVKCGARAVNSVLGTFVLVAACVAALPSAAVLTAPASAPAASRLCMGTLLLLFVAAVPSVSVTPGDVAAQSVSAPLLCWCGGLAGCAAALFAGRAALVRCGGEPWAAVLLPLLLTIPYVYLPHGGNLSFTFDELLGLLLKAAAGYLTCAAPLLHVVYGHVLPLHPMYALILCVCAGMVKLFILSSSVALLEGAMLACLYFVAAAAPWVVHGGAA